MGDHGDREVKKIPYGIADYEAIRKGNYYYVDKTSFLREIEAVGKYLFFIRPRRFGKSLFLSLMETYYDVLKQDRFEFFYKGTDVFVRPTEEKHAYLILKFNFSAVSPDIEAVENSFLYHVRGKADLFLSRYSQYLSVDIKEKKEAIRQLKTASDILQVVVDSCHSSEYKLYILVDEYDNFANTILSTIGTREYEHLTHGEGFFRAFFNVLKAGTTGSDAPISRLFLTGVSPITLDDVTSGFNIGENISMDPGYNQMLGFTRGDVETMIDYYRDAGWIHHDPSLLLELLKRWTGNYRFSKTAEVRMYNADMVLYFLKEYFKIASIPDEPVDNNARIDYRKLRHLMIVDRQGGRETNGNFSVLRQIIKEGEIVSKLVKGFPVARLTDTRNFISLLFYFGLLTIAGVERDQLKFRIPNETIKKLYYEYVAEGYQETDLFSLDLHHFSELMGDMAYEGKWRPLFDYIADRMRQSLSLRDLISSEKSIQTFLNVYLGLSNLYIVHTERELNRGYADIVMEPFLAAYEGIKYAYVLEIKTIKAGKKGKSREAASQLARYSADEKLGRTLRNTTLIKLVLIFSGPELLHIAPPA